MREIKFRVWVKKPNATGGYIKDFAICDGVPYIYEQSDEKFYHFTNWYGEDAKFIIEQFTGLHDSNGKEIYEGSIIEFFSDKFGAKIAPYGYSYGAKWFNDFFNIGVKFVVMWSDASFMAVPITDEKLYLRDSVRALMHSVDGHKLWNWSRAFRVIGTVNENPELLKREL